MKTNSYQKSKRRLSMVPVKGNCKIKPDREKFIKAEIIKLLDERDKYRKDWGIE